MAAYLHQLNDHSILLRLILSIIAGGIIGYGREKARGAAGFRTHILVCMGSALVMLISQFIFENFPNADVERLGAQVISGIGFLGAGTIIVTGKNHVKGLTTAAGLWISACIGLAIGIGFYFASISAVILSIIVIQILKIIDDYANTNTRYMDYYIEFSVKGSISNLILSIKREKIKILCLDFEKLQTDETDILILYLSVTLPKGMTHEAAGALIGDVEGVRNYADI